MGSTRGLREHAVPTGYAVVILDPAGVVQALSLDAERLLGRRAVDVLGTTLELLPTGSGSVTEATEVQASDGSWRSLALRPKLVSTRGSALIVALLSEMETDGVDLVWSTHPSMSELRVAVAAAAPDLRSMTTTSRALSQIMRSSWMDLGPEDRAELAARIDRETALLDRLVVWLLDVARLQRGGLRPRPETLRLSGYLLARFTDRESQLPKLRLSCRPGLTVVADRDQLWRIVNALIHGAAWVGNEPVEVAATRHGSDVVIRVVDQCHPRDPAEVRRLFDPPPLTDDGAGVLLVDLWAVRALARANGGQVWYDQPDDGPPSFCVKLPAGA